MSVAPGRPGPRRAPPVAAPAAPEIPPVALNVGPLPERRQDEPWGWNRRQRFALGILLSLLLAFLAIQYFRRPFGLNDRGIVIIDGQPAVLPKRIDLNAATEAELALIPNIGDTLAARIIAYRDARRSNTVDGIVFRQPSDLGPIPGIGKKRIEQITPYLQFPDDAAAPQ